MFKPRKIVNNAQEDIWAALDLLLDHSGLPFPSNWRFYITDTRRGRCYYTHQVVTVPLWAVDRGTDYFLYYLSHELAHVFSYPADSNHGPIFMKNFRKICPKEFQHFELGYKPRNAKAAGISEKSSSC